MSAENPLSQITFAVAAGSPNLPAISQAALLIGCGPALLNTPRTYSSGASVRAAFAERRLTEIAEEHFALDDARHPLAVVGSAAGTAGVLHLDVSGVTGTSVPSADGTVKPLGDWPGVRVDVVTAGTIGTPGILLDVSIDYGLTKTRVALDSAAFVEFFGKGIKIGFAAGTLNAGDVITGYTDPPRWTTDELNTTVLAVLATRLMFSLVGIAEPVTPADFSTLTGLLDSLEAGTPRRPCHLIASMRRQYRSVSATVTATFANANPDTLTRASGSWITDGFKVGMRITPAGAVNGGNNAAAVRIASMSATVLTMTSNVAFTAEVATVGVVVSGQETDADYAYNLAAEWTSYHDTRITLTAGTIRAARPFDAMQPDQCLNGYLLSRCIASPLQIVPGQRATTPLGGGTVAAKLGGRIHEGETLVLLDAAQLPALVTTPSRCVALQTETDATGPYFCEARTMFQVSGSDTVQFMHMARILNEAKVVTLAIQVSQILGPLGTEPGNPKKLSAKARNAIEQAGRGALQKRLGNAISNAFVEDPDGALFAVDPATDLSTGVIIINQFFRSLFYPNGFKNTLAIKAPGF